jgi:hypothetical protein
MRISFECYACVGTDAVAWNKNDAMSLDLVHSSADVTADGIEASRSKP